MHELEFDVCVSGKVFRFRTLKADLKEAWIKGIRKQIANTSRFPGVVNEQPPPLEELVPPVPPSQKGSSSPNPAKRLPFMPSFERKKGNQVSTHLFSPKFKFCGRSSFTP